MDWNTYIENVLSQGLRDYEAFQNRLFIKDFCLKHGRALIQAEHSLSRQKLMHQHDLEHRVIAKQMKMLDPGDRRDTLSSAEEDLEKFAAFSGRLAEVKRGIRDQYPDQAEEIIEQLDDLVEARLNRRE